MRFRGTVYRAHNHEWAWMPLSGEGARRYGGRFNSQGVPALYCSLSQVTAIREASPLGRTMQPLMLCAYDVDINLVMWRWGDAYPIRVALIDEKGRLSRS